VHLPSSPRPSLTEKLQTCALVMCTSRARKLSLWVEGPLVRSTASRTVERAPRCMYLPALVRILPSVTPSSTQQICARRGEPVSRGVGKRLAYCTCIRIPTSVTPLSTHATHASRRGLVPKWVGKSVSVHTVVVDRAGSDVSRCPGSSDESLGDWHSYSSRTQEA